MLGVGQMGPKTRGPNALAGTSGPIACRATLQVRPEGPWSTRPQKSGVDLETWPRPSPNRQLARDAELQARACVRHRRPGPGPVAPAIAAGASPLEPAGAPARAWAEPSARAARDRRADPRTAARVIPPPVSRARERETRRGRLPQATLNRHPDAGGISSPQRTFVVFLRRLSHDRRSFDTA